MFSRECLKCCELRVRASVLSFPIENNFLGLEKVGAKKNTLTLKVAYSECLSHKKLEGLPKTLFTCFYEAHFMKPLNHMTKGKSTNTKTYHMELLFIGFHR